MKRRRTAALVFDILALVLVLFPILVGGAWIHRPGLTLELTQVTVPVILVALFAYRMKITSSTSRVLRISKNAFFRWQRFLSQKPVFALAYATVFVSLLWTVTSLRRHWSLQSDGFDLGIFTNAIWNLTHGNGYLSSMKGGVNLFVDHQSAIFWLFAPIFSIFPYAETLLVAQAIGLALGAAAVFVLGNQYRKSRGGQGSSILLATLPLLYWAYLPLRRANGYDFHPEVFMLPLFLWAIAGVHSGDRQFGAPWKNFLGWICFILALSCKESAGPVAMGIGLSWCLGAAPGFKRKTVAGGAAIFLGASVFIFDLKIAPALFENHYAYGSLYQHLFSASGLGALIHDWFSSLLGWSRLRFLWVTLAPLAFLPLLAPRIWTAFLPGYLMLFLAQGDQRLSPQFHYAIEPAVGLFWALAASTAKLDDTSKWRRISLPVWIAFWAFVSLGRSEMYWIRFYGPTQHAKWIRTSALQCMQPDVSLTASGPLAAQLATRRWVQEIPDLAQNDCVWLDRSLSSWPLSLEELTNWENHLVHDHGYHKVFECGPSRIYQRQNLSGSCLRCLPECSDR